MAIIQKIRNKYGKVAGAVIVIALLGFILMDASSGRFGDMMGRNSSVAKVDGDKIEVKDYSQRTKEFEMLYAIYNRQTAMDDNTRAQINEQVLNLMVMEKLEEKQCDKLGLSSTKEEEKDLIYGQSPDPMIMQFSIEGNPIFNNQQTGQFDPAYVKGFEQQLPQIDPTGKIKEQWEAVKAYVLRTNKTNKFNYLFITAAYTPKYLMQHNAKEMSNMAGISYVKVPFTAVADNEVKVSDDDIKEYMRKHESQFTTNDATRSIDYVSFDVKPSAEDSAKALNALVQIKGDFANAKDNENFINSKSDEKFLEAYVNKKTFMSAFADSIFNLPTGSVFGPYQENNAYKLTKVIDKKEMPDSVKVRHILVRIKSGGKDVATDSAAKLKLDSAIAAIKGGMPFKEAVTKYSDDDNTKGNGGEYNFTSMQRVQLSKQISKDFADFCFQGKPGETKVLKVKNDQYEGYHYMEIVEQKGYAMAYDLGTITKNLFASDNTENAAYAKATEFAGSSTGGDKFDDAIMKQHYTKKVADGIKVNDFSIQGLGPAREIIRWVAEAKQGDVSTVFHVEGRYIVAKLTSIQNKGLQAIDMNNRPRLEALVKAQKKGEILLNKYKGMASLQAIAQASNQQVSRADTLTEGQSFIPNAGYEPKVVGYTFYKDLPVNKMSPGIVGQGGVYFISVNNRWTQALDPRMADQMRQQQRMMESQMRNSVGQQLQQSLIKKASVKYYPNNI